MKNIVLHNAPLGVFNDGLTLDGKREIIYQKGTVTYKHVHVEGFYCINIVYYFPHFPQCTQKLYLYVIAPVHHMAEWIYIHMYTFYMYINMYKINYNNFIKSHGGQN